MLGLGVFLIAFAIITAALWRLAAHIVGPPGRASRTESGVLGISYIVLLPVCLIAGGTGAVMVFLSIP